MPQTRKTSNLNHVAALVFGRPWAILPADMDVIAGVVSLYLNGEKPTPTEAQEAAASRQYGAARTGEDTSAAVQTVRVIPLHGTISNRADSFDLMSGGTSPQQFARQVRAAADDPNVTEIILDVDSGGGTVAGTQQMYQAVQYAAGKKAVTAVCNGATCSAAYWAISPSTSIVTTGTSEVGSIGILAAWRDASKKFEQEGITPHYYRSGDQKALGGPGEPMTEALDATLRDTVDEMFQVFLDDVAAARRVTPAQARERWGSGRTWIGQAAVTVGLADRLGTLQGEIDRAVSGQRPASPRQMAALAPPGDYLVASTGQPTTNAQTLEQVLGVQPVAPTPAALAETPGGASVPPEILAMLGLKADATPEQIQAAIKAQRETAAAAERTNILAALGLTEEPGKPADFRALAARAADGAAYRERLLEQVSALTITTTGNDEAGQQAAERQKRVWANADITDLQAEVKRLEGVRDGQFPNAQLSRGGDSKKTLPVRPFYARR